MSLPIALDAMGGDFAPGEIVAGARRAVDELGIEVTLVGVPELLGDPRGLPVVACTEVIAMDEDPGAGVRTKKDSSLVRAAELVRDGAASAMVSAGNTGATMAAALLRMGRVPGVVRPCIATPIPRPGTTPMVLVDSGANSECTPEMLVQFAQMASAFHAAYFETPAPRVGLLSIGEEPTKGSPLVKAAHQLLAATPGLAFVGNVEGRDLVPSPVEVVVTDGFTGNVALKTMEGTLRFVLGSLLGVVDTDDDTRAAGRALAPHLGPLVDLFTPENQGGAPLLGLKGVCVISHGSSNATAIMNALRVADEMVRAEVVEGLRSVFRPGEGG
ncbi:MAG: phosphate acyltransferase PlsX [Actinobacteria bacterium 21-73-9]|nr:MAG: phosphate acyltransferase PlsX [Actinobacteria bacterium 21-73-9]